MLLRHHVDSLGLSTPFSPRLLKRKSRSPCPVHAGCVRASGIASSIPCPSGPTTAEPCGDRPPPQTPRRKRRTELVKPEVVLVEVRTLCNGFQAVEEVELCLAAGSGEDQTARLVCFRLPHLQTLRQLGRNRNLKQAKAGRIPSFRIGTCVRFDPRAIANWLRHSDDQTVCTSLPNFQWKPSKVLVRDPLAVDNLDEEYRARSNFFSAFTSEVFRPLVTLLIPGTIAISTWFVGLLWHFPDLRTIVYNNHAEVGIVLALAMTFAGLVLEDIGARVESRLDSRKEKQDGKLFENWYGYLRTAFKTDPIGRRYVRALVLRLKFELGIAFAMLSAGVGVLWLWCMGLSWKVVVVSGILCIIFSACGFIEGWSTHDTLAKNRANLLAEIRVVPSGD